MIEPVISLEMEGQAQQSHGEAERFVPQAVRFDPIRGRYCRCKPGKRD
jgi:hypothetical protein